MSTPIAFIGSGIMGAPMAGHLLAAGHSLTVFNRTKSKADALVAKGARWADSPAVAAEGAQFVFINVTDTPDVEAVVAAILPTLARDAIVIDHSTISPSATQRMAAELVHPRLERHPRAGGGLLKQQSQHLALQVLLDDSTPLFPLQFGSQAQQTRQFHKGNRKEFQQVLAESFSA